MVARAELELRLLKGEIVAPAEAPRVVRPEAMRAAGDEAVVRPLSQLSAARRACSALEAPRWFYLELQRLIEERRDRAPDVPDIDATSVREIGPGWPLVVYGTDFHAAAGRVSYVPFLGGPNYELVVDSWSTTEVRAHLDDELAGVWPASDGELVLVRADGHASNALRLDLRPALVEYRVLLAIDLVRPVTLGDLRTEGVAAREEAELPWGFSIFEVTLHHTGDGRSRLRGPSAGDRAWAQGYAIEMPAGRARVELCYGVRGPRGVAPPALADDRFSDWFLAPTD